MIETLTLAMLAGHWTDGTITEHWVDLGHAHFGVAFAPGREGTGFEFLRVYPHGPPRYVAQPGGGPPVTFPFTEQSGKTVVFVNPEHDSPQRIRYTVRKRRLEAAIGPAVGPEQVVFQLKRAPAPDATELLQADRAFAAAVAAADPGPTAFTSGSKPSTRAGRSGTPSGAG